MSKPHIMVIIIDALRFDRLTCNGYDKPTTPNIDKIANRGVVFENAFSSTNVTDASLTTIFTGLHPHNHGIVSHGMRIDSQLINVVQKTSYISEVLKKYRYKTIALDWLDRWHKKGFDYYSGFTSKRKFLLKIPAVRSLLRLSRLKIDRAETLADMAISLIRRYSSQPMFLFIHFWDTHASYYAPKGYIHYFRKMGYNCRLTLSDLMEEFEDKQAKKRIKARVGGSYNINEVLARYDASIAYVDSQIGRIYQILEDEGLLDETLLFITSDHGESLLEHGIYFDHHGLYDVSIHVPLIIMGRNIPAKKRIDDFVQHIDILPTILDLVDYKGKYAQYDGVSLINGIFQENDLPRRYIIAVEGYMQNKIAIRTKEFKYIYSPSTQAATCRSCRKIHGGIEELYNLMHDPLENKNLLEEDKNIIPESLKNLAKKIYTKAFKQPPERRLIKLRIKGLIGASNAYSSV